MKPSIYQHENKLVNDCINHAAKLYNLKRDDLFNETRREPIIEARQYAMWLLRHSTGLTLKQIGDLFGKYHGTVLHSVRKIGWYKGNNQLFINN